MKKRLILSLFCLISLSFKPVQSLKGTWQFAGDVSNGKKEGAPKEYKLQKTYGVTGYQAFVIEKGSKPEKYEAGNYVIKGDTCIDTETFCAQPSKITNIPIHYLFTITKDTLTLKGILPNGRPVEEYWKRVR